MPLYNGCMANFHTSLDHTIHAGLARALFVNAWSDREEEAGRTYPGEDLMDVAPETSDEATLHAAYVIGYIEAANKMPLAALYSQACKADGVKYEDVCASFRGEPVAPTDGKKSPDAYAEALERHTTSFGHNLGMMALGTGVSWFDDHERFEVNHGFGPATKFVVPLTEFSLEDEPGMGDHEAGEEDDPRGGDAGTVAEDEDRFHGDGSPRLRPLGTPVTLDGPERGR